jgi:O2-independent ubiquinone biosynthesis accessory factor UbiT
MDRRARDAALRFALTTLPAPLLQLGLDFVVAAMTRQHPSVRHRLRSCAGGRILIEPSDAAGAFVLTLEESNGRIGLHLAARDERARATARVQGPLTLLCDLLEGGVDGDALFFARSLSISGDTEAIVALRNALEGEEVDPVADVLRELGPFAAPAHAALDAFAALLALAAGAPSRRRHSTDARPAALPRQVRA